MVSKLTLALVKENMKSRNVKKKVRYYTVNHDSVMRFKMLILLSLTLHTAFLIV